MADDLKPMLTKVLASEGKKRFFFAYGPGRRKDGNGEGELIVRNTKPKKPEVEGALADCKEVFEGRCWVGSGPEDGQTVYLQTVGKKLSPALVPKIVLCAKKQIGRQYDFQLPTPEEEARADKLADGEVDAAGAAPPAAAPPSGAAALQARLKTLLLRQKELLAATPGLKDKLLPLSQAATDRVLKGGDAAAALDALEAALNTAPATGAAPAGDAAAQYLARVKALTDALKKAISTGTAAGNEAKRLFSESQVFFRNQDFARAAALLDAAEVQIKGSLSAAPPAAPGMAEFNERAKAVLAAVAKLKATDPARAAALGKRVAQAAALAQAKDFDAAFTALTAVEADAGNPAANRWTVERDEVVASLREVVEVVRKTDHPDAFGAEVELKAVIAQLNGTLETRRQAAELERYLREDDVVADVCDLAYDLKTPLLAALSEVMPQLAS